MLQPHQRAHLRAVTDKRVRRVILSPFGKPRSAAVMTETASPYADAARTDDGRVARWCGIWGREGDRIRAVLVEGHWDPVQNGLRRQ